MTSQEWLNIFGDNLRDIMEDHKMSQKELSDITDISQSTISKYLSKQQMPTAKALVKISFALDVDPNEFIDFGDTIDD